MPEGDTIYRVAKTLHLALAGRQVTEFRTVLPQLARVDRDTPIAGRSVIEVESRGKHLLIHLSGDLILHSHMRMNGSWHIYRPGEKWRRRGDDMRVVIGNREWHAIGFSLPVAEFFAASEAARRRELNELGPDLLAGDFDREEAMRRFRARPGVEIADALLNQHILAGIGNVYKSEILFVCRVSPFRRVADVSDEEIDRILDCARRQLRANVIEADRMRPAFTRVMRRTTGRSDPAAALWVYGRGGEPCRECGGAIATRRQGPDARSTWWCPRCQDD
ncbi:MAG: DNA-formamidopyrimidine glycosylase family protein [Thermoanaerobaculia bacterium]